jgi:hypothetical protein
LHQYTQPTQKRNLPRNFSKIITPPFTRVRFARRVQGLVGCAFDYRPSFFFAHKAPALFNISRHEENEDTERTNTSNFSSEMASKSACDSILNPLAAKKSSALRNLCGST